MSVIQRIQEKQKWVFGAIVLALTIFILEEYFNRSNNSIRNTAIANVNGETIEYADFQQEETLIKEMNPKQQFDQDQLNEYVWGRQLGRAINNNVYKKLGLVYTGKEFGDAVASNAPPENIRQQFGDRQTGTYNPQQGSAYLGQVNSMIKKSPNSAQAQMAYYSIIKATEEQELEKKYQGLVTGAIYIPRWMAEKSNADNSSVANISFVDVPYQTVADSIIKVSDDDISDYIRRHKKEFEQKVETRQIAYVPFDASPSPTDSATVLGQINAAKEEFRTTPEADINTFLQSKESAVSYFEHYIVKSAIKQPNKDTLFKMQPGQVFGPYIDGGNYALARLVSQKQWADSAKVRHILVATVQQDQNGQAQKVREDSAANKRLDSAIAEIKAGKSWDSVCKKYSDDPGSKDAGGVFGYFATTDQVDQAFRDSSFQKKKGDTVRVHSVYGFHFIQILDQKGSEPAYKYAYFSKPILESQETDDSVREEASKFSSTVTSAGGVKAFYDNAAKVKKTPLQVPGILENDVEVGNIGYPGASLGKNRAFVKWVYQADLGSVSDQPYKFGNKYIVAIVTAINKPGLVSVETARPTVEQRIRNEKKAKQIIESKIKGTTLEAIAQNSAQQVQHADSVHFQSRGRFGSIISSEPSVTGAAFNKQLQGKVSQPIAGVTGVFVIKGAGIAGLATETNVDAQRRTLEYMLKGEIMQSQQRQGAVSPLQKAADIKDYRSKFF